MLFRSPPPSEKRGKKNPPPLNPSSNPGEASERSGSAEMPSASSAVGRLQAAAQDAANSSSSSRSASAAFSDQLLLPREAGRMVSLSACAKFGAVSFVVGVVVGFTLKKRLRRWAAKLLKRIKDDE